MCEDAPCCGCCGPDATGRTESDYAAEAQAERESGCCMSPDRDELIAESKGWPGDGSGEDDLADYNQSEADDYRDE